MFTKTSKKTLIKYIKNICIYITEATEVIYHATHTTVYRKPKTIVYQNNLSTIAVLKITEKKYK